MTQCCGWKVMSCQRQRIWEVFSVFVVELELFQMLIDCTTSPSRSRPAVHALN